MSRLRGGVKWDVSQVARSMVKRGPMNRRVWINVGLSLVVAAGFLFLAFRNVPLADLGVALARFDWRWLVPAFAISFTLQIFRAWRWQLELRPLARIGLGKLWVVTSVAYMAI